jgi:hypothetical protein
VHRGRLYQRPHTFPHAHGGRRGRGRAWAESSKGKGTRQAGDRQRAAELDGLSGAKHFRIQEPNGPGVKARMALPGPSVGAQPGGKVCPGPGSAPASWVAAGKSISWPWGDVLEAESCSKRKRLGFLWRNSGRLPTERLSCSLSTPSFSNQGCLVPLLASPLSPALLLPQLNGSQFCGSSVHSDSHCRHEARCASVSGGGRPGPGRGAEGLQGLGSPSMGSGSGAACRA